MRALDQAAGDTGLHDVSFFYLGRSSEESGRRLEPDAANAMRHVVVEHLVGMDRGRAERSWGGAARELLVPWDAFQRGGDAMPRVTEKILDSGDQFPHLVFHKVGGGT